MLILVLANLATAQSVPASPAGDEPPMRPTVPVPTDPVVHRLDGLTSNLGRLLERMVDERGPEAASREDFERAIVPYEQALVQLARMAPSAGAPDLGRILSVIVRERPTLVAVRVARLSAMLPRQPQVALAGADALLASLAELQAVAGPDAALDPVRVQLVLAADSVGDRARVLSFSEDCARHCVGESARIAASEVATGTGLDPLRTFTAEAAQDTAIDEPRPPGDVAKEPTTGALLRWRMGVSWTAPASPVVVDGTPSRKSPLDGQAAMAWAPSHAGCVEIGAGWDTWRAPGHPDGLGQRRWRVEAGWCPSLLVARRGPLTAALRVVVGGGVAGGRVLLDGQPDVSVLDAGLFARLEVPLRVGPVELGPRVGISPYGRGGLAFGRSALVGFGVAIGGGRQE